MSDDKKEQSGNRKSMSVFHEIPIIIITAIITALFASWFQYFFQQRSLKPELKGKLLVVLPVETESHKTSFFALLAIFNQKAIPNYITNYELSVNGQETLKPQFGKEGSTTFIGRASYTRIFNSSDANILNQMRNPLTPEKPHWGFIIFPTNYDFSEYGKGPGGITLTVTDCFDNKYVFNYTAKAKKEYGDLGRIQNLLIEEKEYKIIPKG